MIRKRTLDLALEYVDRHFGTRYLFPIKPGKKFPPLIKNNLEDASNDPFLVALAERAAKFVAADPAAFLAWDAANAGADGAAP